MIHRRRFLNGLAIVGAAGVALVSRSHALDIAGMKPGEFFWDLERAPQGPVVIIVSLPAQRLNVYRNGELVAVSTTSTGKPGHETPTGVFTILQKDKDHHSSIYNNASMPYTERLTWSGVALHAGNLPGYPTSHGCVHLPLAFAKDLFGITGLGTTVIIADRPLRPGRSPSSRPAAARRRRERGRGRDDHDRRQHRRRPRRHRHRHPGGGHRLRRRRPHLRDGKRRAHLRGPHHHRGRPAHRPHALRDEDPAGRRRRPVDRSALRDRFGRRGAGRPDHRIPCTGSPPTPTCGSISPPFSCRGRPFSVTQDSAHPGTRSEPGFVVATHPTV